MALISHSLFNPAFLVSEPVGAAVCLGVFLSLTPSEWRAGISVFVATLVSGIVFAVLVLAAGQFTIPGPGFPASFISPFVLLIIATAAINSIIAGMLFPRIRNFRNRGS
jgi:drug/metabolite transporter (DMT)-like permease